MISFLDLAKKAALKAPASSPPRPPPAGKIPEPACPPPATPVSLSPSLPAGWIPSAAEAAWERAVVEVGGAWDVANAAGREPLWPAWDADLVAEVGAALRGGDPEAARAAIAAWREVWRQHLAVAGPPRSRAGQPTLEAQLLEALHEVPFQNVRELATRLSLEPKLVGDTLILLQAHGKVEKRWDREREPLSRWKLLIPQPGAGEEDLP